MVVEDEASAPGVVRKFEDEIRLMRRWLGETFPENYILFIGRFRLVPRLVHRQDLASRGVYIPD